RDYKVTGVQTCALPISVPLRRVGAMCQVSAIITTFNRAELLRGAIASVLSQTLRDFELIILDNSSADHTRAVLAGIEDRRVRCRSEERRVGKEGGARWS